MAAIGDRQVLDVQTKSTTVGPRASSSAASATFSCVDMFWLRATCAAIPAVVQQNAPRASSAKRGWRDLTATAQAVRTLTESPSNGIYAASFSGSWFANRFFQEGTAGAAAVYWMPHQRRASRQRLNRLRSKPAGA